jgi:hypothetical protein
MPVMGIFVSAADCIRNFRRYGDYAYRNYVLLLVKTARTASLFPDSLCRSSDFTAIRFSRPNSGKYSRANFCARIRPRWNVREIFWAERCAS